MKRFLSAVGLCGFLLIFGFFVFLPTSQAENNLLVNLLNLPAPPPANPLMKNALKARPESFYNKSNPPKDDAPIEDLLIYWAYQNQFSAKYTYAPEPSAEAARRLLAEIEKDPERLPEFINALPKNQDTIETVKRLYDQELGNRKYEREWRDQVKKWLTYNSRYFSDELLETAEAVAETEDYVTNQDELLALARVDWEKARPILERMLNNREAPVSQTLARWAFYEHALKEDNTSDIEKYRRELQATVENRGAGAGNRDLAMDALVEAGDFEGRDDWYFSLLSDETLFELRVGGRVYTGLTTLLNHSPSEKYVAKMLELVKSENAAVRNAAVRNLSTLLSQKNPEVIKALLPWMENPKWAKEVNSERRTLVSMLDSVVIPESVPGLIAMMNEKETREVSVSSPYGSNTNTYSSNTYSGAVRQVDYYPYRSVAISGLAAQKDIRAVPALRLLLPQVEEYERRMIIRALLFCGGYSVPEQVEALELVAKNMGTTTRTDDLQANTAVVTNVATRANTAYLRPTGNIYVANAGGGAVYSGVVPDMKDARVILGFQIAENTEPGNELVAALLDRIELLDRKEPSTANALRKIIQNWRGAAVNSMLLRDLKNNKSDIDGVVKLLSLRKELREKQFDEVSDIRGGSSIALGIAACLTESNSDYDAILAGENAESKIAMLGCARLIRAPLPVGVVAKNLQNPNKMLALAAERYLESEDSQEARMQVLAVHPNEARVLGARNSFSYGTTTLVNSNFLRDLFISVDEALTALPFYYFTADFEDLTANERKLQKEVRENQELLGVYSYDDNFIRIYKDKAVFSWEEDVSRYRERVLTKEEFDAFKGFLASEKVDEIPPFLSACEECDAKELVMLGRGGGRRVFVRADDAPKFFAELEKMFDDMRKPPAKLHYWLEKNIAGLEILFADENLQARSIWKNGDDFRVLIDNEARRKQIDEELEKQEETEQESEDYDYDKSQQLIIERRAQRKYENFAWYRFEAAKLSGVIAQPPGVEFIRARDDLPAGNDTDRQWKARAANFEIRANEEGLYKISGGRATRLRTGFYTKPLVTPNGRWAIATKYSDEGPPALVRVNLLTGRELKIKMEQYPTFEAVAFLPSINKALVFGGTYQGEEEYEDVDTKEVRSGEYFLLDVETGLVQPVKGEIRPLAQQTFRALQPTGKPDEFWAAIPDEDKNETQIGVYNAKTLAFKSQIKLPQIAFDSMNMWVDEKERKIYFVYEGHLLAAPLG
ncbi:MAG TPA: hypothetical protein VF721_02455 [Pyrinomonadaceae bacterium]|jgi:HEAT repeat protein